MSQFPLSHPFLQELFPLFSGTKFEGFRGIKAVSCAIRTKSAQTFQFGI